MDYNEMDVTGNSRHWPCCSHFAASQGKNVPVQPALILRWGWRPLLWVTFSRLVSSYQFALCRPGPNTCWIPPGFPRKHLAGPPNPASSECSGIPPHRPVTATAPQNCSSPSFPLPAQTHCLLYLDGQHSHLESLVPTVPPPLLPAPRQSGLLVVKSHSPKSRL